MSKPNVLTRYIAAAIIIVIGVLFIAYGIKDGEAGAVLRKAVAICMECIGIG